MHTQRKIYLDVIFALLNLLKELIWRNICELIQEKDLISAKAAHSLLPKEFIWGGTSSYIRKRNRSSVTFVLLLSLKATDWRPMWLVFTYNDLVLPSECIWGRKHPKPLQFYDGSFYSKFLASGFYFYILFPSWLLNRLHSFYCVRTKLIRTWGWKFAKNKGHFKDKAQPQIWEKFFIYLRI